MSTEFDFNINNYTIPDIENFLNLRKDYTFNDVIQRKEEMVNIIISNKQYDTKYIKNLTNFMNETVIKIAENIKKTTEQNNGFIEDYDKLIIETDEGKVVNQTSTTYAGHNFVMNKNTVEVEDILGKNKRANPIETYQTNIARSNLNVVKRKTYNQTVMMNTLFREDYENTVSTDFNIVLPTYFKNVLSLRLSSLQLPNVMYNISAINKNNIFFIEVEAGGPTGIVTMPDGNYDISSFGWFMGYRKSEYGGLSSYTTEAVYSSSPYDYIYFTLNDYNMSQSQNIFGMFSKSILGDNILAVIPVTSNSFNICFDNGVNLLEKKREYYGPVNIQRLKIQLLNQYGEVLNLNNMDFSFSLEFEIGYDW